MRLEIRFEDLYLSSARVGMLLTARCGCGYVCDGLVFGAGMSNFQTQCAVPARCRMCRRVVVIDYVGASGALQSDRAERSPGSCPSCGGEVVAYVEQSDARPAAGLSWRAPGDRQLVLPASGNVCPQCETPGLSFAISMMFD